MFSCADITSIICRHLEACDVFSLMKADKATRKAIGALLVGATVRARVPDGKNINSVVLIPLLGIHETIPRCVTVRGVSLRIQRLRRIRELGAEILSIVSIPSGRYSHMFVYLVGGYIRHCISFTLSRLVVAETLYAPFSLRLAGLSYALDMMEAFGRVNRALSAAVRDYGVTNAVSVGPTDDARNAVLADLRILTSEAFLRFIALWGE